MEIDPNRTPAHPFRQYIAHSAFPETTAILAMDALRGYSAGWLTTPVQSTLSGKASGFCLQNIRGTDDETRTHTACATPPQDSVSTSSTTSAHLHACINCHSTCSGEPLQCSV